MEFTNNGLSKKLKYKILSETPHFEDSERVLRVSSGKYQLKILTILLAAKN